MWKCILLEVCLLFMKNMYVRTKSVSMSENLIEFRRSVTCCVVESLIVGYTEGTWFTTWKRIIKYLYGDVDSIQFMHVMHYCEALKQCL